MNSGYLIVAGCILGFLFAVAMTVLNNNSIRESESAMSHPTPLPTAIPTPDRSHIRYAYASVSDVAPSESQWESAAAATSTSDLIITPTFNGDEYIYYATELDRHDLTYIAACFQCPNVISSLR